MQCDAVPISIEEKIISIKVNSDNEGLKSSASTTLKELFGEKMVQSFYFRTCVEPDVIQDDQNQISKIRYSSQGPTKLVDFGHSVRRYFLWFLSELFEIDVIFP